MTLSAIPDPEGERIQFFGATKLLHRYERLNRRTQ